MTTESLPGFEHLAAPAEKQSRGGGPGGGPSAEELLEGLNEPQRAAVVHEGSPLLVVAGAGSGKTNTLAYRVEQLVTELQERLPVNEKARAEQLVADARQAINEQAGLDRVRPLIADLQQMVQALPVSAAAAGAGAHNGNGAGGDDTAEDEEEVVDAEFTRE